MYHIFFIHSSVGGHLGCFHALAIVYSAAVNIGVHVSFQIMAFSRYMTGSEIAGSFVVQSLSCIWLFVNPWTAACQASLSIPNSWSLLKLISIESVMPSSHLILCRPLLLLPSIFSSISVFSNESVLPSGGRRIGVSASTTVLPMNTQDWSLLGWTGWISLESKGLSRVFSNTTVQKHQLFSAQLSL